MSFTNGSSAANGSISNKTTISYPTTSDSRLSSTNLKSFINHLCQESARVILPFFRTADLAVQSKADNSPVTLADTRAEEVMRKLINKHYPDHGIVGEEYGSERETADYVWFLDPIDGTITFTCGTPLFGTLIGLTYKGQPLLGAINQPVLSWCCIGDVQGTTINGTPCKMRETDQLADARLFFTDPQGISKYQPDSLPGFAKLCSSVSVVRTWGDCYGYLLLADGRGDIMLDPAMKPWDIMALIPIIEGAGGVITDWQGKTPVQGQSCVAATRALHPLVLELLNS